MTWHQTRKVQEPQKMDLSSVLKLSFPPFRSSCYVLSACGVLDPDLKLIIDRRVTPCLLGALMVGGGDHITYNMCCNDSLMSYGVIS